MRERRFFAIIFLTFSLLLVSDARVRAATLEQLVEGAKKERTLEFYGPCPRQHITSLVWQPVHGVRKKPHAT